MNQIQDAAFHTVHDYAHGGARALSLRMGFCASSLSHQVRSAGFAKLGLVDAAKLVVLTGDARILHAFAEVTGHLVVPLPAAGDEGATSQRVGELAREFADVVTGTLDALADGRITPNELARVQKEWGQLVSCGAALMGQLTAMAEASVPGRADGERGVR